MSFPDNPKPSDSLDNPTPHKWEGWGYDTKRCSKCLVDAYETNSERTEYCEDIAWAKEEFRLKKERQHRATEEAFRVARAALTKEQWELLGLNTKRPYRDKDYLW